MSVSMQTFLADSCKATCENLIAAVLNLPEDKRLWSPAPTSRSAINLIAECALGNAYTAELIETSKWPDGTLEDFIQAQTELTNGEWETLEALLRSNTERFCTAVRDLPDDRLNEIVELPLGRFAGKYPISFTVSYCYWNMSYHEGQINYIASILGELK
ncbi:MAG: DinB family protein [Capsulimonas sp.]|uniref:DinB family protein n=1 Tax=Capsulimonas sp. TaxID=2494211 RepID=UPI003265986C